jgi:hypothetical protein
VILDTGKFNEVSEIKNKVMSTIASAIHSGLVKDLRPE